VKPYYQDDAVAIYNADCREAVEKLGGFDAIITDPPYGIGWSRGPWNDSPEMYDDLMKWLIETCQLRVVIGWVFIFQAMKNCAMWHRWFPEGWRIYAACKNFVQRRPTGVWHSWDPVVFWKNGEAWKNQEEGVVNRDWSLGNSAGAFGEKSGHPCPRRIEIMKHIVSLGCAPGHLICDPFMGSGTTLRAAKDLGRKAIGIEIEEKYCEIAAKRMSQEVLF